MYIYRIMRNIETKHVLHEEATCRIIIFHETYSRSYMKLGDFSADDMDTIRDFDASQGVRL